MRANTDRAGNVKLITDYPGAAPKRRLEVALEIDAGDADEVYTFPYHGVERFATPLGIRPNSGRNGFNLLAIELANSRDGIHETGAVKSFNLAEIDPSAFRVHLPSTDS